MQILIADSNALRHPGLEQFLAASHDHAVCLSDWTLTEMRKRDALSTSRDSLKIVFKYPRQCFALRRTDLLLEDQIGDRDSAEGLIDARATLGLRQLSQALWQIPPHHWLESEMERLERDAVELIARLRADVEAWADEMVDAMAVFSRAEVSLLRSPKTGTIPHETMRKVFDLLLHTTRDFMIRNQQRGGTEPMKVAVAMRMFGFRYSLCILLYTLGWVRTGSQSSPSLEKLVNDVIDLQLATVGTFFNGVLSRDAKLQEISQAARHLLRLWGAYVGEDWPPSHPNGNSEQDNDTPNF